MYLRQVRAAGRTFAAALTRVQLVVTPPEPAAQKLRVGLPRLCRRQACGGVLKIMHRLSKFRLRRTAQSVSQIISEISV
jgi:hypothetical protein